MHRHCADALEGCRRLEPLGHLGGVDARRQQVDLRANQHDWVVACGRLGARRAGCKEQAQVNRRCKRRAGPTPGWREAAPRPAGNAGESCGMRSDRDLVHHRSGCRSRPQCSSCPPPHTLHPTEDHLRRGRKGGVVWVGGWVVVVCEGGGGGGVGGFPGPQLTHKVSHAPHDGARGIQQVHQQHHQRLLLLHHPAGLGPGRRWGGVRCGAAGRRVARARQEGRALSDEGSPGRRGWAAGKI